jgi:hypothetical protein
MTVGVVAGWQGTWTSSPATVSGAPGGDAPANP